MMKKTIVSLLMLCVCQWLLAGNITQQAARQKAMAFMGKAPMKLVAKGSGDNPAYYVFNAERAAKGFVIVAGEDVEDNILGFSEHGEYNQQTLPPALEYWLQCYSEQIALIRSGQAERHRTKTIYQAIEPLITTQWDQDEPYNVMAPVNPMTGKKFEYTGCVATAVAQILKYWASPVATQTIPAYTYYLSDDGNSYSTEEKDGYTTPVNVEELPSTTFDYSLMQDSYEGEYSEASANEVAKLMAYVGRAAQMRYLADGSTTQTNVKVFQFFGFNPNCTAKLRADYTAEEWDDLIYGELSAKRPMVYRGSSQTATGTAGHAFVCDGYKDGYYHLNWGWSGHYNGYFKLSEANSRGTGSGSGNGKNGYNFGQTALVYLQPDATEPEPVVLRMNVNGIATDAAQYTRSSMNENFSFKAVYAAYNTYDEPHAFDGGIAVCEGTEIQEVFTTFKNRQIPGNMGKKNWSQAVSWGSGIANGVYLLRPVCRESGSSAWLYNQNSEQYFLVLTVNGNTLTVTNGTDVPKLQVNAVTVEGLKKVNRNATLRVNLTNIGIANSNALYLFINGKLNTGIGVNVDPGATDEVLMDFLSTTSGTFTLELYGSIDSNRSPVGNMLWSGEVTIAPFRAPQLTFNSFTVENADEQGKNINGTTFTTTFNITNTDSEAFEDLLLVVLFRQIEGTDYGEAVAEKYIPAHIPSGADQDITASFDGLTVGKSYFLIVFKYTTTTQGEPLRIIGPYTIQEGSGIARLTIAPRQSSAPVFNLNGQRVAQPAKGLYIQNGKKFLVK